MFNTFLAVLIGGGVGSVARWFISLKLNPTTSLLPIGTLTVNLAGAFIIGLGIAIFNRMTHLDPVWKMLLTTGFCGGMTTFSTFSLEVVYMLQDGRFGAALLNIALNLFGSLALTLLGFMLVSWYTGH
ncbi:fluoride efflux transporter CrcB [Rouxiella badensis]|jgi:CrcB protein|uniref:Fluoride-specific ion channel FluC n=1 Tax=Rouxiella badensis TaxID=1646377 RepID=A0A1X0WLC9_9GAMM|nr:fluoride efflux transporter CrcB [Rouxiella badensis]MCC3702274.1 fluoride efflux transporter CrcB [Rouxiella badensis]MCC3717280.1 fluoride efflux transporter CrcB [Rouxiella badensis]MCC3728376.1 fluoride efflux transporter CrcB [Rouxiella badensis]MCC3732280.1 fluoride efflux transporter CrcB [Rouxiella badensis]MCC3740120.1 fluoride efflux transporter CrcB [Rouxiella badensis]